MRIVALLAFVAPSACAPTLRPQPVAVDGPEMTLALGHSEHGAIIIISIRNRSDAPFCISAEAIRNPDTIEMELRLRDPGGAPVRVLTRHPFTSQPIRETVRVDPSASVEGRYYLDSRFPPAATGRPLSPGYRARARFHYGDCHPIEAYCDGRIGTCPDVWSLRADSGWRRL
jgi:hypothetical protein